MLRSDYRTKSVNLTSGAGILIQLRESKIANLELQRRLFLLFNLIRSKSRSVFLARKLLQSGPAADGLLGFIGD